MSAVCPNQRQLLGALLVHFLQTFCTNHELDSDAKKLTTILLLSCSTNSEHVDRLGRPEASPALETAATRRTLQGSWVHLFFLRSWDEIQ